MTRRIALHLTYQGRAFYGYQIQPAQRTVQGELEKALAKLLQQPTATTCAGRTDTGVHALAQLVHFDSDHPLPVSHLPLALNSLLPDDLRAVQAWEVDPRFSARYSALMRHYRYLIRLGGRLQQPLLQDLVWDYQGKPLDLELLKTSWQQIQGYHSFKAFCKTRSSRSSYEISVRWSQCWQHQQFVVLELMAQSFLRNMVRGLVGTAVDIARGHLPPDQLQRALQSGERRDVGKTAPAQGLYLYNVLYPPGDRIELIRPELHQLLVPMQAPREALYAL